MKRALILASAVLLACLAAAGKEESTAELRARAESASGGQKALLYAELVQRGIEEANQLFNAGEAEKAQNTVKQAVHDAERARDAALAHSRKIKDTEIRLRKAERRLNDIRRTLAIEDQPDVQVAVDQIVEIRKQLLEVMFAPKEQK